MTRRLKFVFGPVSSRRLGASLGVDVVSGPSKVCTLDCVYCQLGTSGMTTVRRRRFCGVREVAEEVKAVLAGGIEADFITFSGCGEPTLHSGLGGIIRAVKRLTTVPVAVLTNGTLFYRKAVRDDCLAADVVLPSLDAGAERPFRTVRCPHPSISLERLVRGLEVFRRVYRGQIWLEVFLVEGLNTGDRQITGINNLALRIAPDKIHLNTAARTTAEPGLARPAAARLRRIAGKFGPACEVVGFLAESRCGHPRREAAPEMLLSVLKRRPCSLEQICSTLSIRRHEALKRVEELTARGLVGANRRGRTVYYRLKA
jgi:wyosine [tRNA(Phe)-imidazoG37] synthetase (radical SAM superfamily)